MSRKGKLPIALPQGVEVKVANREISVKGPKGTLKRHLHEGIDVKIEKGSLHVLVADEEKADEYSAFHGLDRALIQNLVTGVTTGFEKKLEMIGVGYRAAVQGKMLDLQLGFSHPTQIPIPEGIAVTVEKGTAILIKGIDKQAVGQFAAETRDKRPPEVYQGKGIRYQGEYVRKKAGKAAASKK